MTAAVIILACLLVLVLLLFIPLRVELRGNARNRFDFKVRFIYLFGLVRWETALGRRGTPEESAVRHERDDFDWIPRLYRVSQTQEIWERSWELVRTLWCRVHFEKVSIALNVSLGEDYYTGVIAGGLIPVCLFINRQFATDINLTPSFEEDLLIEGHINADARMVPMGVMAPCLAFLCSSAFRRARDTYHKGL